mgnify:CR=1 FL=1
MKTYSKVLYENTYSCYPAWGSSEDATKIESYVKFEMHFDFKEGLRFSISIPNFGTCSRNPFKCIFRALEHESIGMGKYQRLKDRTRKIDCWRKL